MTRTFAAALTLVLGLFACPSATAATDADQIIRLHDGQVRCLLSADFEDRGYPAAVCARTDGGPFSTSHAPLNLAVVQGTGELYYLKGTLPDLGSGDAVVGVGQTYRVNGWTVETEELRAFITYDVGRHGINVSPLEVLAVWK